MIAGTPLYEVTYVGGAHFLKLYGNSGTGNAVELVGFPLHLRGGAAVIGNVASRATECASGSVHLGCLKMNDQEFFDFAYEEYKTELTVADMLYQRTGIVLAVLVLIGKAAISQCRVDLLGDSLQNVAVFLFHTISVLLAFCLLLSVAGLTSAVFPRQYPRLRAVFFWQQWRGRYRGTLIEDEPDKSDRNEQCLSAATRDEILKKLTDSHVQAVILNERRLRAFRFGMMFLVASIIFLAIQAVISQYLKLNGV